MAAIAPPAPDSLPEPETGGAPVVPQPEPPPPPSFGVNNRNLPDDLKDVLTDIVKDFQNEEMYDRRIEDLVDRALRFYDDGVQHFYPNFATGVYQIGEAGGAVNIGNANFECSEYLGAYNIFRARRRTIDAVLTQNPPGIDFQPDKPNRTEDIEAAETAEGYWELFKQKNDLADIQQSVTRYFELSGRVVAWTHTKADRQLWGLNAQGEPRAMETCEVFGTLESTVPILCRRQKDAVYCYVYKDMHILQAKEENPWLKENGVWKISGGEAGPGESEWKRYARLGVRQARKGAAVLNTTIGHLITEQHCFIRSAAFNSAKCDPVYTGPSGWDEAGEQYIMEPAEDENGEPQTIGEFLLTLFPEGVHIKFVGKCLSEATPESMDDAIDIVMSEKRDSMTGGALMEPMKIVQDGFNDFKNAEREFYEKGWPTTWFKGDQEEYDAFVDQKAAPAQFALLKNGGGPDIPAQNFFYREPDMTVPESFQACMEGYRGPLSQDITGASPALEGIAGPHDETASQRVMDKTQSIGILGPTWNAVQRLFAGIAKKAALLAAKNPDHEETIIVATGDQQSVTLVLKKLTRGSFHCRPDQDSTFPDSTGAQRALLQQTLPLIMPTPIGADFLSEPENWEEILRVNGMTNFVLTPAEAAKKQIREIDLLLRQSPQPNQQAVDAYNVEHATQTLQSVSSGLPPPPYMPPPAFLPSIMPEQEDYHASEYRECTKFLSSQACWREIVENANEDGVKNVRLHAQQHALMGAMPQPFAPQPLGPLPSQPKVANKPDMSPQTNAARPQGAPTPATV